MSHIRDLPTCKYCFSSRYQLIDEICTVCITRKETSLVDLEDLNKAVELYLQSQTRPELVNIRKAVGIHEESTHEHVRERWIELEKQNFTFKQLHFEKGYNVGGNNKKEHGKQLKRIFDRIKLSGEMMDIGFIVNTIRQFAIEGEFYKTTWQKCLYSYDAQTRQMNFFLFNCKNGTWIDIAYGGGWVNHYLNQN